MDQANPAIDSPLARVVPPSSILSDLVDLVEVSSKDARRPRKLGSWRSHFVPPGFPGDRGVVIACKYFHGELASSLLTRVE